MDRLSAIASLVAALAAWGAGAAEEGYPFSQLPPEVRENAKVYDARRSCETDNPFGVFAHNELPAVELVNLMADMGLGHTKLPQSDPDVFVPLADKLGIDVVVNSHLPDDPKAFAAIIGKHRGKVRYFQTGGDEPNNNNVKPADFVGKMARAAAIFRAADPKASLIMDDLGDEHTADYFEKCLAAGLAQHVDYASYGYFQWGSCQPLFRRMSELAAQESKKGRNLKLFLAPLEQFRTGFACHKQQKHFAEFFWQGAELINLYKLIDWAGEYSMLHFDGSLTANYAGFQTLCQFLGNDVPPDREMRIEAEFEGGFPEEWNNAKEDWRRRTWIRPFRNAERLFLVVYLGNEKFSALDPCPSGHTLRLTLPTTAYGYPVAVDMITGRLHDLPHRFEGAKLVVDKVPADTFAWGVLLLKRNPDWERSPGRAAAAPPLRPDLPRSLTNVREFPGGDWVTALLPDGKGGAWIGLCPLHLTHVAVARVDEKLQVTPLPFAPRADGKPRAPLGGSVTRLASCGDFIYGVMRAGSGRGFLFRFKPDAKEIADCFDPGGTDKLFGSCAFTGMEVRGDQLWLTAIGTATEGKVQQGEGVAVFNTRTEAWKTYTHRRPDELADKPAAEWSGRMTGIAQGADGIWVSAMGLVPSFTDGAAWHPLPRARQTNWTWCVAMQGHNAWFGGNDGQVHRVLTPRIEEMELAGTRFAAETFDSASTGLKGRVLHTAALGNQVWFTTRYEGVAMYDAGTKKWRTWLPGGPEGLPECMIEGVLPRADHVWMWTWGGGMARLKLREDRWEQFRRAEGMVDNRVSAVVEEADGTLWVGTFRGLSRWRPAR
ncbi:MAG: hypothetical protein NTW87_17045 [Planctomycetota bacterium]|nr:hypothetical protein [Planctomycetota bacterium]